MELHNRPQTEIGLTERVIDSRGPLKMCQAHPIYRTTAPSMGGCFVAGTLVHEGEVGSHREAPRRRLGVVAAGDEGRVDLQAGGERILVRGQASRHSINQNGVRQVRLGKRA